MSIASLYRNRFPTKAVLSSKIRVWKILCEYFFAQFIDPEDTVLDLGAGYCEFINHIHAKTKIAFDINPDVNSFASENVKIINHTVDRIKDSIPPASVNKVFISNFLEHMPLREDLEHLFRDLHDILKDSGCLIIIQPNIKYVGHAYWDFFDHKIPLTEKSLIELSLLCGFEPVLCIKRFLPFTFKSHTPQHPFFVWLYLKLMPISNNLFGKQSLLIVRKVSYAE
jgi:SAM-dependent methyltransferase